MDSPKDIGGRATAASREGSSEESKGMKAVSWRYLGFDQPKCTRTISVFA
jgi:hypothetical protein